MFNSLQLKIQNISGRNLYIYDYKIVTEVFIMKHKAWVSCFPFPCNLMYCHHTMEKRLLGILHEETTDEVRN